MKKLKTSNWFIIIEFLLCFVILVATLLEYSSLASLGFYLLFALLLVEVVRFFKNKDSIFTMMTVILVWTGVNILLNLVLNRALSSLGLSYLIKYLIFCSTIIFLYLCTMIQIDRQLSKTIITIAGGIGWAFIICYFVLGIQTRVGIQTKHLTMNFSNPNLLGLWLLQFVLYSVFAFLTTTKGKMKKAIWLIETVLLTYLIWQTGSRTAIICVAVFIAFILLYKLFNKALVVKKWVIWLVLLFPLLIAVVYLLQLDFLNEVLSFLASEGKGIDSRLSTWDAAIYYFKLNIVTGSYYEASGGSGAFQMHNSLLDILSSYGFFICVLVLCYVYGIIQKIQKGFVSFKQTLCLLAFFIVWIMGFGEAALFSGGQGIYIVSCSFLLLARNKEFDAEDRVLLGEKK